MPVENNFTTVTDDPYILKEHDIQQEDITTEVMKAKRHTEPWPNKSNAATSTIMGVYSGHELSFIIEEQLCVKNTNISALKIKETNDNEGAFSAPEG